MHVPHGSQILLFPPISTSVCLRGDFLPGPDHWSPVLLTAHSAYLQGLWHSFDLYCSQSSFPGEPRTSPQLHPRVHSITIHTISSPVPSLALVTGVRVSQCHRQHFWSVLHSLSLQAGLIYKHRHILPSHSSSKKTSFSSGLPQFSSNWSLCLHSYLWTMRSVHIFHSVHFKI